MQEKILENKKHGMRVLLCCILLELVGLGLPVYGGIMLNAEVYGFIPLFVLGVIMLCVCWIPLIGLRVLKNIADLIKEFGLRGPGYWQIMQLFRANWLLLEDNFYVLDFPIFR